LSLRAAFRKAAAMYHYRLFGGILRSDLEIPELEEGATGIPTWTLRSVAGAPPSMEVEHLGTDAVNQNARVHLYRHASGLRMVFDDTGCFDISDDGSRIDWTHSIDVSRSNARADLTSRVLAASLYASGTLCLHGSAVVPESEAIGFVAPKYHGKSTLAMALVRSGARLLTDDTLPVAAGPPAVAQPGLHATRLWPDSAERVGMGSPQPEGDSGAQQPEGQSVYAAPKRLFSALPGAHVSHDAHPLAALYLLSPVREPRDGAPVWRTRLTPIQSALLMIGHAKLAPLLTKSEAPALFRKAAQLAAEVPVYRLNVVRDLDRLDEVVHTIRSWHSAVASAIAT
jgi:hypothetical protein